MITSAPDALAFHEKAIEEMWGRALKGQAAADLVRRLLAEQNVPVARGNFTEASTKSKRGARNKPPALM